MISYGMGEHSIVEIAEALDAGIAVSDITYISGTTVKTKSLDSVYDAVMLPSFEELKADRLSVFTPSTVIRIHFPENVWSNRIPNIYMWYRTLRQNR